MAETNVKISYSPWNKIPFHTAIKAAQQRGVVLPEVYYGELQGLARQQAFSIAGLAALDQLEQVRNSLSAGLQRGISFNKWQKEMLDNGILELPSHRLDNIFRTNIQSNYNRGHWEKFQRTKASRPYLMYDAINDSRVRPAHLALDGIIRPVDDDFWSTHAPLNGYRCRCRLISLSEKQAQARSGADKGINKPIKSSEMQPDKGWDYNPGRDLMRGVEEAIAKRTESKLKTVLINKVSASGAQAPDRQTAIAENMLNSLAYTLAHNEFSASFYSVKSYDKHLEKRIKNGDIKDAADYHNKTMAVIQNATALTVAIPKEGMVGGKLQITQDDWIVLIGIEGRIITSYPFDERKVTFEERHKDEGDQVYEYIISAAIRTLLKGI
ncbi:MAG: phage minor head protein [Methyloprofundus sp.]|nr:phage minor head protein [Methyloprofundus sp.]